MSLNDRRRLLGHGAVTIWLIGLSASGKSTLAFALERTLIDHGKLCYVLDGDNVRHGMNSNLGFNTEDRAENIQRVSEVAKLMNAAGVIVIAAFISPYEQDRKIARDIIGDGFFREGYISTSLGVCERRDPKGIYRKAREGSLLSFTGITSPYEEPRHADLCIDTAVQTIETPLQQLLTLIDTEALGE